MLSRLLLIRVVLLIWLLVRVIPRILLVILLILLLIPLLRSWRTTLSSTLDWRIYISLLIKKLSRRRGSSSWHGLCLRTRCSCLIGGLSLVGTANSSRVCSILYTLCCLLCLRIGTLAFHNTSTNSLSKKKKINILDITYIDKTKCKCQRTHRTTLRMLLYLTMHNLDSTSVTYNRGVSKGTPRTMGSAIR